MVDQDAPDPYFGAMTTRLLRRKTLPRTAEELKTTSRPGLEEALARISEADRLPASFEEA